MRNFLLICALVFCLGDNCMAQELVAVKNKLTHGVTENFNVQKSDNITRQGLYQAFYKRNILASGQYINGQRSGQWHFYNYAGQLMQNFDFDKNELTYEAPEDSLSHLRYFVDKKISDTDLVRKPLRIGGRYFGYLPYLNMFKAPFSTFGVNTDAFDVRVELLISPLGRLADYKVYLFSYYYQYQKTISLDVKLFKPEDRLFIPAMLNKEPILSRVIIHCSLTSDGSLEFYN